MRTAILVGLVAIGSVNAQAEGPALPPTADGSAFATAGVVVSQVQATTPPASLAPPVAPVASPPAQAPEAKPPTLEELGKKVELLGKNLTVVTGDEHFKLVLGGAVIADFIESQRRTVAAGTPFFLDPGSPFGYSTRTFDASARQTSLFGLFTGPDVCDFKSGGFVLVNLYDNSVVADLLGVLPINAYGELKNDDWRIAAGLQFDVFNPLNPTVLPFSLLGTSGNTGFYRTALRLERYLHPDDDTLVTLTASLGDPVPTTLNDTLRINEDNGLPNLDVRAAVGIGPMTGEGFDAHRTIELGMSAVCGKLRTVDPSGPTRVVTNVYGLGVDARWVADPRWGIQGEGYIGQGLGTYGASGLINTNPNTFQAIRTSGMFVEGWYYWRPDEVHTHVGYGIDNPIDHDAGATLPICNQTYYATTLWDITKAFRLGFQVSYVKTNYSVLKDNQGFIFQGQFQWKF
ncbi:MAG TPA: hypothetical protein VHR66_04075 [Gemmataceae bacterium]|jgi:hypothetical protein|nr:hypothetical protein [Gemmataceae bacterium]